MTTSVPTIKELADEIEFQVLATIDICNWVAAIARAIARDVQTGGGSDVLVLTDLAKHFDDTGAATLSVAFDQFRQISILHSAPRSAQPESVSRTSVGGNHE